MILQRPGLVGLFLIGLCSTAAGQIPFTLLATQQGQSAQTLQNGGGITVAAPVGGTQTLQVVATYTGTGQVTFSSPPTVFGSTAFTVTLTGSLPITLSQGGTVTMTITFSPTSSNQSTAQVNLPFVETVNTTLTGGSTSTSGTTTNSGTIAIGLQGTAPSFTLSYILQGSQNVIPLQPAGTIPFPATLVNATSQAALNITNTGSGLGTVTGITISSSAFTLQQLTLLPANVAAGQNLQVLISFTPTTVGTNSGQVTITFSSGTPISISLTGSGIAPSLTYQLLTTTPPTTIAPPGPISFPSVNVSQTSSISIRILNSGSANGTINSISVTPQVFQLANPVQVPQTLAPNASLTVTLNFTPTQPGTVSGTLIINSDAFDLKGTGLGSQLVYSYLTNGTSITLGSSNPSVIFSPVQVTRSQQLTFDVKNSGTLATTISNIGVTPVGGPYSLSGVPALPVSLAPDSDFQIGITFTPTTVGFSNGTLILDNTSIALVGSGTEPPALPSYTITGPSGNIAPMTQPTVGLTLSSPYPVAVSGTLAIGVNGSLPTDPAVQFATGGSTASFVIPANQTAAVFGSPGTQIGLQTGTVADTITLTPSFSTQAGNISLTPNTPATLQFAVAPSPPQLIAIQLSALSSTGFTIQVTGFSTTRSLKSAAVQLTPAKGYSLPMSQFTIDLSQISTVWFQSTASKTFGGAFAVSIPFTFQGLTTTQSVLNAITAVSATVSSTLGTSNSLQTNVP